MVKFLAYCAATWDLETLRQELIENPPNGQEDRAQMRSEFEAGMKVRSTWPPDQVSTWRRLLKGGLMPTEAMAAAEGIHSRTG
jgi:hypothetical protein